MNYTEKVVLITGGAGGLGKAFAKEFLAKGSKVCIADLNEEIGNEVLEKLQSEFDKDRVCFAKCDVTSDDSFTETFDTCKEELGDVNVLINNAGCGNEKDWNQMMNVNLGGCFRGTELGIERMDKQKGHQGGNIINIASIAGVKTIFLGPLYGSTKAGIIHYSRAVGHPFHSSKTEVQVQSLCPSLVDTAFLNAAIATPYSERTLNVTKAAIANKKLPPAMPVEKVSEALIKLLEEGIPGAALVVELHNEPYYVETAIPSD